MQEMVGTRGGTARTIKACAVDGRSVGVWLVWRCLPSSRRRQIAWGGVPEEGRSIRWDPRKAWPQAHRVERWGLGKLRMCAVEVTSIDQGPAFEPVC